MKEQNMNQQYFQFLVQEIKNQTPKGCHFFLSFTAENTQFIRLNASKIRQIGTINDAELSITWLQANKATATRTFSLTGQKSTDSENLKSTLKILDEETKLLPPDPYASFPAATESTHQELKGQMLPLETAATDLTEPLKGIDLAGIYSAGRMMRGMAHSMGTTHWFSTEIFSLDYSIYNSEQKAVKGTYAGANWDPKEYKRTIHESIQKLEYLGRPSKKLSPGAYRVYLEPAAVGDIIHMFSWGCISEQACRKGSSPLRLGKNFSSLFSLHEDFSQGAVPRFNDQGKIAPMKLELIHEGNLKTTLISERTAQEYQIPANGANDSEALQSPKMLTGTLAEKEKLKALNTGIWISNLHYLNWSEISAGKITGMTRYACLWVENGEPVGPIENMRFDDSIFNILGTELEAVSSTAQFLPEVGTYEHRQLGGSSVPGILVRSFQLRG